MWTLPLLRFDAPDRPRLSVASIRQLARLGTIVRWPGLVFAAIVGLIEPPKAPVVLALLLVGVALYNGWAMSYLPRVTDAGVLRLGRALTLLDTVSYFALLAVFTGAPPTSVYPVYILLIVWMVAYDGAEGAMLAVAIFVIGSITLQGARVAFFHLPFNGTDVLLWSLTMGVVGAIIAAFDRIVLRPAALVDPSPGPTARAQAATAPDGAPAVHLSRREQEVLRLVAEGYSNAMIASRLHLSENTIKTYVETLLTRLHARNRAEAVASATRQNLI